MLHPSRREVIGYHGNDGELTWSGEGQPLSQAEKLAGRIWQTHVSER